MSEHAHAVKRVKETDATFVLKNVTHMGVHGYAIVPKAAVRRMIFQREQFFLFAAHTQVRLQFAPRSIQWFKDEASMRQGRVTEYLSDLVQSIEAIWPRGSSLKVLKGTKGVYPLVFVTASLDDKIDKMITAQGHTIEQWLTNADPAEAINFIRSFALASNEHSYKTEYELFKTNCTNTLLRLMAANRGIDERLTKAMMFNVAKNNKLVTNRLNAGNFLEDILPSLNDEISQGRR